jgi:hypothetical protein
VSELELSGDLKQSRRFFDKMIAQAFKFKSIESVWLIDGDGRLVDSYRSE